MLNRLMCPLMLENTNIDFKGYVQKYLMSVFPNIP